MIVQSFASTTDEMFDKRYRFSYVCTVLPLELPAAILQNHFLYLVNKKFVISGIGGDELI